MAEVEKLIKIYQQLEDAGLMVVAGKKDTAELMVSHDVVPVVRCKDCKAWNRYEPASVSGRCGFLCKMRMDDDFCSYGERKDNA